MFSGVRHFKAKKLLLKNFCAPIKRSYHLPLESCERASVSDSVDYTFAVSFGFLIFFAGMANSVLSDFYLWLVRPF